MIILSETKIRNGKIMPITTLVISDNNPQNQHPMEATTKSIKIDKELIPSLHIKNQDILLSKADRRNRYRSLYLAMLLGNNYKSKVKITFITDDGPREVETTVWMTTDENVMLKAGVTIPIGAIISVDF